MSRQPRRLPVRTVTLGLTPLLVAGLVTAGVATAESAPPSDAAPAPAAAAGGGAAPALFGPVAGRVTATAPRAVAGQYRLVALRTSALPDRAAGQSLDLDLGGRSLTARVEAVDHRRAYTAWSGSVPGDTGAAAGSFTIVRTGTSAHPVYKGAFAVPGQGTYDLTRADDTTDAADSREAGGSPYWLTTVAPEPRQHGDDARRVPPPAGAARPSARTSAADQAARKRGVKVAVMFAYTKAAKQLAGSVAQLKADAALVLAQTNQTLANSGLKVKVTYKGLVKAKGTEGTNPINDAFRVARPHDGHFDQLQVLRRRHHADLIHLFTGGPPRRLLGGGLIPYKPSTASPASDASVSHLSGLPYLVSTHELGHNLGADHIKYPGVAHNSKVPFAYGFYNVPGRYLTVMGYYDPCSQYQIYDCVRLPYFSSPTRTFNGQPLGLNRYTDNTKVVALTAPHVARYAR